MRLAIGAVCVLAVLAGCAQGTTTPTPTAPEQNPAGDIPDNQVFVPFTANGFTVSVPEGWARTNDGDATVFTDKFNSVRVEAVPHPGPLTVQTATTEELPPLRSLPGYQAGSVTYEVTSPPDPVTGKNVTDAVERYEFWRTGTEAVLTLSGPKGADNVDPWRTITDSLRWPA